MSGAEAFTELSKSLQQIYDRREAENIADWTLEHITGKKKYARNMNRIILSNDQQQQLKTFTDELLTNKPVQYVLNESFFCGYKFFVNENVLIPRPETEELVYLIAEENKKRTFVEILEIGTGSGKKNALDLGVDVGFLVQDFTLETISEKLPQYDIIVSNPPYIPKAEKETLDKNVVDFEPGLALFVPDDDPLLFYKKIARFAKGHLRKDGVIYLEVHESYAKDVEALFTQSPWHAQIINDMYGKERMVKVT